MAHVVPFHCTLTVFGLICRYSIFLVYFFVLCGGKSTLYVL